MAQNVMVSRGGQTRYGSTYGMGERPYTGGPMGGLALSMPSMGGGSRGGGFGGGGGSYASAVPQGYMPRSMSPFIEQDENTKFAQNMAADAQRFQQQKFNTVWGALSGLMGNMFGGGGPFTAGGSSGASPEISVGGVYNPQQIDQQVNAARAKNDATTAGRVRDAQQQMAARGFGSSSPLLAALTGRLQNQNLATNADSEREIRMGAAGQNAEQLLRTQQAREAQFASRQAEDIERRKPYFSTMNSLFASLAGLA